MPLAIQGGALKRVGNKLARDCCSCPVELVGVYCYRTATVFGYDYQIVAKFSGPVCLKAPPEADAAVLIEGAQLGCSPSFFGGRYDPALGANFLVLDWACGTDTGALYPAGVEWEFLFQPQWLCTTVTNLPQSGTTDPCADPP